MRNPLEAEQVITNKDQNRHWPIELTIVVVLALVVSGVAVGLTAPPAYASCIGHCYGALEWPGTNIGGSSTFETVHLNSPTNYHISEELWEIDGRHTCSPNADSWIEAGEATQLGFSGDYYFWADCRPGSQELHHFLYQPPSGDFGQFFQYFINYYSNGEYALAMFTTSGTEEWNAFSTNDSITPGVEEIGLETTNTDVTSANPDVFYNNQYEDAHTSTWHYQVLVGDMENASPPTFIWAEPPAPGNNGGEGETTCC